MLIARLVALMALSWIATDAHAQFRVPATLSPERAARFERFESFRIRGVCGVRDLERLSRFGVNTVRGYTIPSGDEMRATLDEVHGLGMKMVVSEWMPNQGENTANNGGTWSFDYDARGDRLLENFVRKIEAIGDHPAILMWGLGNEVHLDEPYLRTVNRMSEAIHERFPHHVTSLTMINAKPEAIEKIKRFAPDLDTIGVQSYSPGAVRGSIRKMEEHWGRPFYLSEFNGKGPWNFGKTSWGEAFDEPVTRKLADLGACYDAIDSSPLCMGSTIFVWGYFRVGRPTYFSLLLAEHPDGAPDGTPDTGLLMTPQAELMVERFAGSPPAGNRAPVLSTIESGDGERYIEAAPGERVTLRLAGTDPDGDRVTYRCWVLDSKPRRAKTVAGPFETDRGTIRFDAPRRAGDYLIMAYALDGNGGGSASTLPLGVRVRD